MGLDKQKHPPMPHWCRRHWTCNGLGSFLTGTLYRYMYFVTAFENTHLKMAACWACPLARLATSVHAAARPRITPARITPAHTASTLAQTYRNLGRFWLSLLCVRRARCADEIKRRTLWTSRPFSGVCRPPLAVCVRCCSGLWSRVARAKLFAFYAGRGLWHSNTILCARRA